MREHWKKYQVKDIIEGLFDGPHATPAPSKDGPVFLGVKNLTENGRFDLSVIRHIAEKDFPRWTKRVLPKKDDIVFSYEASLHRYGLLKNNLRCCLGRRMALLRLDKSVVDPKFLLYYFLSSEWKQIVERNIIVGATVDRIPISEFPSFELSLPSLPEQTEIASVLSSLDAKISLNHRINAELEAMAKLLYDYWFVQFDFPDENGRPYQSSGGKMRYDERLKREVPEGWGVFKLSDHLECNYLSIKKKNNYDFINYLDTSSLTENVISNTTKIRYKEEKVPSRAQRIVQPNDILYSTVRPNQRHFGIIKHPSKNMIASTGFAQLSCKSNSVWNNLFFVFLTSEWIINRLQQIAELSVSSYPSISPNDILDLRIVLPTKPAIIDKMSLKLDSLFLQIANNHKQNHQLASLRDWLLPMLMNGQVRVGTSPASGQGPFKGARTGLDLMNDQVRK